MACKNIIFGAARVYPSSTCLALRLASTFKREFTAAHPRATICRRIPSAGFTATRGTHRLDQSSCRNWT
ncbi:MULTISPECIES: hypothetical protein [Thiorhodovibrio]|uniref:hypothetical protein n=1 Tax=Thiorhodovibrio TaxID=61593 RepID=UPI001F5D5739|nr:MULTISPECIES: hypothetical protein [Thiorhodovibrio]WPL14526.1 hypothetical protein Thiosp_04372 [Thiorhodovibrio litoralis]